MKEIPYKEAASKGFGELRDVLLDMNPLNTEHIKAVNLAEAGYWKTTEGERVADSTDVLGFDCGGQQLVVEVLPLFLGFQSFRNFCLYFTN